MRIIGNNPQLSRQTQGTASGAITGGKPVVVNTDGTVSEISATAVSVAGSVGTAINTGPADSYTSQYRLAYDTNRDKGMIVYRDDADSNQGKINILSVSGTDVSKASDVVFHDGNVYYPIITFDSNNNMALVAFRDNSQSGYGRSKIISGSGTTATAGGLTTYRSASSSPVAITFDNDKNRIALFYIASGSTSGSSDMLHCITGEINGATSITWRDNQELTDSCTSSAGSNSFIADACFDSNLNKVVFVYRDAGNSNHGTAVIGTFAGDGESITFGTPVVFNAANTENIGIAFDSNTNKVVIVYTDKGNSDYNTAIVGTVSGTTISFGSEVVFSAVGTEYNNAIAFDSNTNKMNVFFNKGGLTGAERIYAIEGTVSGTSISFGTEANINSSTRAFHAVTVFDPDTNQNIIAYLDISGNVNQQIYTPSSVSSNLTASTSEAFIGFAEDTVATGQPVTVNTKGAIADNILPQLAAGSAGTKVVVADDDGYTHISTTFDSNSDKVILVYQDGNNSNYGTAVVGTVTASDKSISFGTPAVFESAATMSTNVVFDSNSNKVVITYRDTGNSNRGTAIVGTVSGTSISFGSAAVFETGETINMSSTFDSSNNKVVIAFEDEDDSGKGKAIVGTVSGTSISFGTAAVFNDADTGFTSTAFDTTNNKVVIAFADKGNSNRGTAIVGTVSGTDISFGSEAIFNSGTTAEIHHSISFNPVAGKMLIAYIDTDDSEKGKAIVGTVSGTSISFGTASEYNSRPEISETVYDSERDLIVIAYGDNNNSRRATAIGATISGTSVSFSAELAFDSSSGNKNDIHLAYDSSANRVVAAYYDSGNSNALNSTVFTTAGNGPITPAQTYYVQTDGTLSQTADSPSVTAGTAVAGSTLIVKG